MMTPEERVEVQADLIREMNYREADLEQIIRRDAIEKREAEERAYELGWWRGLRVGLFLCLGAVVLVLILASQI